MNDHDGDNLQAPPQLAKALQNLQKQRVFVPPQLDEAILRQAHQHLAKQERKIVSLARWAALAASIALAAGLVGLVWVQKQRTEFAAGDINRDGEVNILDAFALARSVGSRDVTEGDFNGDGVIDEHDVEALAQKVVELDKRGRS